VNEVKAVLSGIEYMELITRNAWNNSLEMPDFLVALAFLRVLNFTKKT
jgi:hypothetical protein